MPWKAILTSTEVVAILVGHFACNWGDYTLQAMLPTYMSTVQNFDIASVSCHVLISTLNDWILIMWEETELELQKRVLN